MTTEQRIDALKACAYHAEVARLLEEHEIKGIPLHSCECPVSRFLQGASDADHAEFDGENLYVWFEDEAQETLHLNMDEHAFAVSAFVELFDNGEYSHLDSRL